jgi:hypothetical protein
MSTKIYLFKTHPINITNLALAQLIENAVGLSYETCSYSLRDNKFFKLIVGKFAQKQTDNPANDFRHIDWSIPVNLSNLNQSVELAATQNKFLIFGNNSNNQIDFLKTYYTNDIVTIGINYNENMYLTLLDNMVKYHIYLLNNNSNISQLDRELLNTKSSAELIDYYTNTFNQQNLIPRISVIDCDYTILVDDFFNKSVMAKHYINLGVPFTIASEQYYDTWLAGQSI